MGHWYPTEWCGDEEVHGEHIYVKNRTAYACFGKSAPQVTHG